MIAINYRDPRPIYEQIQAELRRLMLTGALPPGSRLPSVRELAGQLGLPYAVRHIDAAALALENHLSVEEAGRDARYAFFAETAGEGGRIATAHTLDDTIETVLMNLIRGTGLHGLCGIPRIRGNIVRPLLDVTRAEVEEYLALLGQPYCTDSTNLSDDYTRNRVRHDILPRLCELNPNFTGAMARMLLPKLFGRRGRAFVNAVDGWADHRK